MPEEKPLGQKIFARFFCGTCAAAAVISFAYIFMPHGGSSASSPAPDYDYEFSSAVAELDSADTAQTSAEGGVQAGSIDDRTGYYYNRLSDTEKAIYLKILETAASPHSIQMTQTMEIYQDPASDEFVSLFTTAYDAVMCDRPDLFWIYNQSSRIQYIYKTEKNDDDSYDVAFRLTKENENYEYQKQHFDDAVSAFMSDIDQTASEHDVALQIHDKLLETVEYKDGDMERSDDAHDAYGALVNHEAVCDGYSLAYEYLLRQAGIDATMVYGQAGSGDSLGSHAWNLVEIDGDWYEVDVTWDDGDMSIESLTDEDSLDDGQKEIIEKALQDEEYSSRLRHYMFLLSTEEIENYDPKNYGDKYVYTSDGGTVTITTKSRHIRNTKEDIKDTSDYVSFMAPTAKTSYTEAGDD